MSDQHQDLQAALLRLVRLDTVGPSLQPDLVSRGIRQDTPEPSRYPGSTMTLSPPKLKAIDQLGLLSWQSTCLLSWAFPGYRYSQLPVGHVSNLVSRLSVGLPRPFTVEAAELGAQQLDGSDVWLLMVKLTLAYTQKPDKLADVSELQPNDFGVRPGIDVGQVQVGLWRSPIPLSPAESTLDARLEFDPITTT